MPSSAAKFSSGYLPKEQMHSALMALPEALQSLLGDHKIIAMYGWASKIHGSLLWQPMEDDTGRLKYLIEDSIEQRIVIPGESDFIFEVPDKRLQVTFCHESDIHLNGSDDVLLKQFMTTKPYLEMRWYTQEEVAKLMT
jgi:hypothetical protein